MRASKRINDLSKYVTNSGVIDLNARVLLIDPAVSDIDVVAPEISLNH